MRIVLIILVWFGAFTTAAACSLCSNPINRATLGEEMDNAAAVVIGTLSNPKLHVNPRTPGAGTTDLTIERLLKTDGSLAATGTMTLQRYMPVADPKQPPRMLIFFDRFQGQLTPLQGVAIKSDAVVKYLEGARAIRPRGRVLALRYYATFLDHADEAIALDAFMEFAKSKDDNVAQAAAQLDPQLARRLLASPSLDADRMSLFAFLLGCCGNDRDAETLAKLLTSVDGDQKSALDGILAGYVTLRPDDGWKRIQTTIADAKLPFATRFASLRTVRVLQGWKGEAIKANVLAAYRPVIRDGELADLAVEDLRRWRWWDLTDDIAAQLGSPTHRAPIVQHCLIRYALSCPTPAGKAMVARARQIEPDYVEDQERLLAETPGR